MLLRNGLRLSALTTVLLATAAAPALADTGFYVGATAGRSLFHQDKSSADAAVLDAFSANGLNVLFGGSSSLDKTDFAFGGLIGYRLTPQFSIEAAYMDLGKLRYRATDTVTSAYFVPPLAATVNLTGKVKGPTLAALGILPLSPAWDVYGRAGLFFSNVKLDADIALNYGLSGVSYAPGHGSVSANSVDPLVGLGVAWHLADHVALRAEYTRFVNVGDKNKTGQINIDLFNLGVTYSFR
jgi:opacity protein-like surface antigen